MVQFGRQHSHKFHSNNITFCPMLGGDMFNSEIRRPCETVSIHWHFIAPNVTFHRVVAHVRVNETVDQSTLLKRYENEIARLQQIIETMSSQGTDTDRSAAVCGRCVVMMLSVSICTRLYTIVNNTFDNEKCYFLSFFLCIYLLSVSCVMYLFSLCTIS